MIGMRMGLGLDKVFSDVRVVSVLWGSGEFLGQDARATIRISSLITTAISVGISVRDY